MALEHQHGPGWLIRPQVATGPSVATRVTDINSDPWTQTGLVSPKAAQATQSSSGSCEDYYM